MLNFNASGSITPPDLHFSCVPSDTVARAVCREQRDTGEHTERGRYSWNGSNRGSRCPICGSPTVM